MVERLNGKHFTHLAAALTTELSAFVSGLTPIQSRFLKDNG